LFFQKYAINFISGGFKQKYFLFAPGNFTRLASIVSIFPSVSPIEQQHPGWKPARLKGKK
jgi:hypothetical protein